MRYIQVKNKDYKDAYLFVMSNLLSLTDKEQHLISEVYKYGNKIDNNRAILSKNLGVSKGVFNTMVKKLADKGLLIKVKRGVYDIAEILIPQDSVYFKLR